MARSSGVCLSAFDSNCSDKWRGGHNHINNSGWIVRELTRFKGEADTFKGDVPNQRVRDAAKEAMDAMFAATDMAHTAAPAPMVQVWGLWLGLVRLEDLGKVLCATINQA